MVVKVSLEMDPIDATGLVRTPARRDGPAHLHFMLAGWRAGRKTYVGPFLGSRELIMLIRMSNSFLLVVLHGCLGHCTAAAQQIFAQQKTEWMVPRRIYSAPRTATTTRYL